MKKSIIKALVLILTFVLGLVAFGRLTNQTNEDLTAEMADAVLPLVSLYTEDGVEVNELHGYVDEMNACYMRDEVLPVPSDRIIPLKIKVGSWELKTVSYELRSLDMERLIARGELETRIGGDGIINCDLKVENILEKNQEYSLVISLSNGTDNVNYYTRLAETTKGNFKECLDFVIRFHETTFDPVRLASLSMYMEPDATGDNTTLNKVTIKSSLKQVGWADFPCTKISESIPSVKELNDSYAVIEMKYTVVSNSDETNGELYNVEEYYRVRYSERIYLLNYERTMNEVFRINKDFAYENKLQLGIRDGEVEYKSNDRGDIVCFVQEGELWCYNENTNNLAMVFSYNGYEGLDNRENYQEHDIKIINIDETGSANFVVYGYVNAGNHEGQVGLCVYHYDSVANTVEEELFVPATTSYQILKEDLGKLMYENKTGKFFFIMDEKLYRIDLMTMELRELVSGLVDDDYVVSEGQGFFAYRKNEYTNRLYVMNLDTEITAEVSESGGVQLMPLGFMKDDLVYGMVRESEITEDIAGNAVYPIYGLKIRDSETGETLKEYSESGIYISEIDIEGYVMHLTRVKSNGIAYVETTPDTIMNKDGDKKEAVAIESTVTDVYQRRVQITMANNIKTTTTKLLTPKEIVLSDDRTVVVKPADHKDRYYVYAKGDVVQVTTKLTDAISTADELMGTVLNDDLEYIWKRAKAVQKSQISVEYSSLEEGGSSLAKCLSAMLSKEDVTVDVTALMNQGKSAGEILETALEGGHILELSGCDMNEVLYYVGLGNPVLGMKNAKDAVLILGYDNYNIVVFDPELGETHKVGLQDSTSMFAQAGNIFLSYLR